MHDLQKIAFFTPKLNFERGGFLGVQNKVQAQIRAFQVLGFEVKHFTFSPYKHNLKSGRFIKIIQSIQHSKKYYNNCFESALAEIIEYRPDTIYIRYSYSSDEFIYFLKNLRKVFGSKVVIIIEIATFPYGRELILSRNYLLMGLFFFDIFYRRKLKKYLNFIVTYSNCSCVYGVPTVKISNGINNCAVPTVDYRLLPEIHNGYHFIGVSNLMFWTGYERIILGLAEFNGVEENNKTNVRVYFHIVGDGVILKRLMDLVIKKNVSDYVVFHGAHSGSSLSQLFQNCHLAIGNLGVHRKGMVVNPDLKNREYCARGIPFVTSTQDPGFPKDFPYMLLVPADETPINIQTLVDFCEVVQEKNSMYVRDMRKFSEEKLDWTIMLKPIVDKIE